MEIGRLSEGARSQQPCARVARPPAYFRLHATYLHTGVLLAVDWLPYHVATRQIGRPLACSPPAGS